MAEEKVKVRGDRMLIRASTGELKKVTDRHQSRTNGNDTGYQLVGMHPSTEETTITPQRGVVNEKRIKRVKEWVLILNGHNGKD